MLTPTCGAPRFAWQIRLCSVIFDGPDPSSFAGEWEMKRSTLQELVAFHESDPKAFTTTRIAEDAVAMVCPRRHLFCPV